MLWMWLSLSRIQKSMRSGLPERSASSVCTKREALCRLKSAFDSATGRRSLS
jgi:hypothetical protein